MTDHQVDPANLPPVEVSEDEKLFAILAYVPVLCLIPFTRTDRTDFVTGHVRLGMTLFVIEIFALILRYLRVVWDLVLVLCIIGALAGIFHVVRGRRFFLPYLSDLLSRKF